LDDYSALLLQRDLAAATLESYSKAIKLIKKGLGEYDLAVIDTPMAVEFLMRY